MAIFLILLWIASVIALFVGLVKPSLVLPRRGTPPTRKRVGIVYGVGSFVLFLWGGSAAGREQAKEEARALQADSASVQTLLARAGTLNPAEAQRVDAIIHRRHFTFAHDAVHSRVIDARLDSAATLLGQDGKHAAAKDLLATGFSEPLTVDQKAHRESLQGQTTAAIAKDEEARNRAQAEAKFADNQGLLDSAAALLQANADGWGNVTGGRAVLNQLGPLTPEQTARKNTLLAMADRQYILIEESAVRIATKLMLDQRRQFARNLETQMLDNNFNVTITTPGRVVAHRRLLVGWLTGPGHGDRSRNGSRALSVRHTEINRSWATTLGGSGSSLVVDRLAPRTEKGRSVPELLTYPERPTGDDQPQLGHYPALQLGEPGAWLQAAPDLLASGGDASWRRPRSGPLN